MHGAFYCYGGICEWIWNWCDCFYELNKCLLDDLVYMRNNSIKEDLFLCYVLTPYTILIEVHCLQLICPDYVWFQFKWKLFHFPTLLKSNSSLDVSCNYYRFNTWTGGHIPRDSLVFGSLQYTDWPLGLEWFATMPVSLFTEHVEGKSQWPEFNTISAKINTKILVLYCDCGCWWLTVDTKPGMGQTILNTFAKKSFHGTRKTVQGTLSQGMDSDPLFIADLGMRPHGLRTEGGGAQCCFCAGGLWNVDVYTNR